MRENRMHGSMRRRSPRPVGQSVRPRKPPADPTSSCVAGLERSCRSAHSCVAHQAVWVVLNALMREQTWPNPSPSREGTFWSSSRPGSKPGRSPVPARQTSSRCGTMRRCLSRPDLSLDCLAMGFRPSIGPSGDLWAAGAAAASARTSRLPGTSCDGANRDRTGDLLLANWIVGGRRACGPVSSGLCAQRMR